MRLGGRNSASGEGNSKNSAAGGWGWGGREVGCQKSCCIRRVWGGRPFLLGEVAEILLHGAVGGGQGQAEKVCCRWVGGGLVCRNPAAGGGGAAKIVLRVGPAGGMGGQKVG